MEVILTAIIYDKLRWNIIKKKLFYNICHSKTLWMQFHCFNQFGVNVYKVRRLKYSCRNKTITISVLKVERQHKQHFELSFVQNLLTVNFIRDPASRINSILYLTCPTNIHVKDLPYIAFLAHIFFTPLHRLFNSDKLI